MRKYTLSLITFNHRKNFVIASLAYFFIFSGILAQEQVGISSDPASGWPAVLLNPASSSRYPYSWQANIFSAHLFGETNYAYVSRSNLFSVLNSWEDIEVAGKRENINDAVSKPTLIFDRDGGFKSAAVQGSVLWPSFLWKPNERQTLGFYLQTRATGSLLRLPEILGYYEISEIRGDAAIIPEFSLSGMVWSEIGFHLSRVIQKNAYESTALGINAKLILPHEGGRFASENEVLYARNQDTYNATGLVTRSGYNVFPNEGSFAVRFNGIGLATDLGYHLSTNNYSLGVSILDLGFSRVSGNAESYNIISDTTLVVDGSVIVDPNDLVGIIEEVDRQLEGQVSRTVTEGDAYALGLPTAFSLQYGRRLGEKYALSAHLIQRFPVFANSIRRPNSLSFVPRYESGFWSISLPVSLYEYKDFRFGTAIRYRFFYVGSDHLLSLMGKENFSGSDLYLGFHWYPFAQVPQKKGVECYRF